MNSEKGSCKAEKGKGNAAILQIPVTLITELNLPENLIYPLTRHLSHSFLIKVTLSLNLMGLSNVEFRGASGLPVRPSTCIWFTPGI